jgi:23S rRNA (uridine2552-2'-O)-methyltransferase
MRLQQARRDYYRKAAKREGFRSRAAYKLLEINNSYRIMRKGMYIVDLGCAPGGWLQAASRAVGADGKILGVDRRAIEPVANVLFIEGDVEDSTLAEKIMNVMGRKVDVILSDTAPNISGVWHLDHARQISLAGDALSIAEKILIKNGNAVFKTFEGPMFNEFRDGLKRRFKSVHVYKPRSSRKESSEMYLVCLGYKGSQDL